MAPFLWIIVPLKVAELLQATTPPTVPGIYLVDLGQEKL